MNDQAELKTEEPSFDNYFVDVVAQTPSFIEFLENIGSIVEQGFRLIGQKINRNQPH